MRKTKHKNQVVWAIVREGSPGERSETNKEEGLPREGTPQARI